ncbi:MAG: hypothetical protein WCO68_09055 [Verrucomicrobiota bacterium]
MDDSPKWFLMKQADGEVFGPMPLSQLRQWALDACISPLDKVSSDEVTWIKAPMLPELEMDYLLEVEPGLFYGPTTIGAIREFLTSGEISLENPLINCHTGDQKPLREYPQLFQAPQETAAPLIRINAGENLQARIRQLEEALLQERLLRKNAEELRAKADGRVAELEEILGIR